MGNHIKLSASLITFNEESFLGSCLESIQKFVDEIVVVDTGSTDRTIDIANNYHAKLFTTPWPDSFSAARNEALNRCQGDWVLYIDADEQVEHITKNELMPYLDDASKIAHTVKFYPKKNYTSYREYRIFRNDSRIKFEGVIHESMLSSIRKVAEDCSLEIGETPLVIRHNGYESNQESKHRRNLPLLQREVNNRPDYSYLWWHLGCTHLALKQMESAEKAWIQGLTCIRSSTEQKPYDSLIYGDLIRLYHSRGQEVGSLLSEATQKFPDNYFILWLKAVILKSNGDFESAADIFEMLANVNHAVMDKMIAYDTKLFGVMSIEPLGDCYFKLNKFEKSLECYRKCEALQPDIQKYKIKRVIY